MVLGPNSVLYVLLGKIPITFYLVTIWPNFCGVASGCGWLLTGPHPLLRIFMLFLPNYWDKRDRCFGLGLLPCAGSYGPLETGLLLIMSSVISLLTVCLNCYRFLGSGNY